MARGHEHPIPALPEALASPGLIIRTSINLGEQDRIIQFEGFVDRDATLSEIHHLCDKIRKAGDRQRAIHALPAIRRHLDDVEYRNNDNKRRLAELNAGEKAMNEARAEKAQQLQVHLQDAVSQAQAEHERSGRRGEFKAPAQVTRGPVSQLEALREAEQKEHAENAVQRLTLENEIKEGDRAIAKQNELIAEYEALTADGPE